jgi:hypothetical protein
MLTLILSEYFEALLENSSDPSSHIQLCPDFQWEIFAIALNEGFEVKY